MDLPKELVEEFVGNAHGNFTRVKELLEQHPELLNASAPWDETAIQAATQMENVPIMDYLIEHGADPNLLNYEGITPLKLAVEGGKADIAAILRAGGGIE